MRPPGPLKGEQEKTAAINLKINRRNQLPIEEIIKKNE